MSCTAASCGAFVVLFGVCRVMDPDRALAQVDTVRAPSQAWVNVRLDSLERLALTSADRRSQAVSSITKFGEWWLKTQRDVTTPPFEVRYHGIVDRLARIYRQSDSYSICVSIMGSMIHQAEQSEAITFLEEIAAQDPERGPRPEPSMGVDDVTFSVPYVALHTLTYMGPQGRAALERLHVQLAVRERSAQLYLDRLARHGFRREGY